MLLCPDNRIRQYRKKMARIEQVNDKNLRKAVIIKHYPEAAKEYSLLCSFDSPRIIKPIELTDEGIIFPLYPQRAADGIAGYCSEREAWRFIRDVSEGLAYLHGKGLTHQDIKPSNILIDESGYIISDFDMGTDHTSYAFTPPEWDKSRKKMTALSDIWSLGASVFTLVNGSYLFSGRGGSVQKESTPIPSLSEKFSKELRNIVQSCLSFDPSHRPSAEYLHDLAAKMAEIPAHKSPKSQRKHNDQQTVHEDIWPESMSI